MDGSLVISNHFLLLMVQKSETTSWGTGSLSHKKNKASYISGGAKDFFHQPYVKNCLTSKPPTTNLFQWMEFMRFQADHYVPSIGLDLIHKVAMNGHQPFPWQRMQVGQQKSTDTRDGHPGYKITSWGLSGVWPVWYERCFGWCFGCLGLTCRLEIPII